MTGGAQPVQNAEQRAGVVTLIQNARDLSNVRAQPYDLKTTFVSNGGLPSDGSWTLQDTSPGRGQYRWTAQGPNYAAVNLYTSGTQNMLHEVYFTPDGRSGWAVGENGTILRYSAKSTP